MSSFSFKSAVAMLFSIVPTLGTIGSVGLLSTGSETPISTTSLETKKRQKRDLGETLEKVINALADSAESSALDLHASQDSLFYTTVTSMKLDDALNTLEEELGDGIRRTQQPITPMVLSISETVDDSTSTTSNDDISWGESISGIIPEISTEDMISEGLDDDIAEQSDNDEHKKEESQQSSESKEQKVSISQSETPTSPTLSSSPSEPQPEQITDDTVEQPGNIPSSESQSSLSNTITPQSNCSTQTGESSITTVCFEGSSSDKLSKPKSSTPKKAKRSIEKDTYVYWKGLWQFLYSFWKAFTSTDRLRAF